jgi:Tol biopolymer transport system component
LLCSLFLCLTAVLAIAGTAQGNVTPPGTNGKIAFSSDRDNLGLGDCQDVNTDAFDNRCGFEIYTMNPDGSGLARLTNNTWKDDKPSWSPDGTQIAFESRRNCAGAANDPSSNADGNCFSNIFVMDSAGGNVRQLTFDSDSATHPTWSPDGTKIAFESLADGKRSIWVMQADGLGVRRLTDAAGAASDSSPAWSPDGSRIAFASDRDGNPEIYVVGVDGTGAKRLTNNPAADGFPAWSPDGARLAFLSDRDGQPGVWAMAADGSAAARLVSGPASAVARPAWSPDGRSVAFASDREGGNLDIFVADTTAGAGGPVTRVISSPGQDGEPAWSADGARLAFASDRDGGPEVYVANRDGSNVVKLTTRPKSFSPTWAPNGAMLAYINDPLPGS